MTSSKAGMESLPNVAENADLIRVGYLEECLRHIQYVASRNGRTPNAGLRQVERLAQDALERGDPLTCPEARK